MFGMGTGGSLRLLSPEIFRLLPRTSLSLALFRTLKTAQVARASLRFPLSPSPSLAPSLSLRFRFAPNDLTMIALAPLRFALTSFALSLSLPLPRSRFHVPASASISLSRVSGRFRSQLPAPLPHSPSLAHPRAPSGFVLRFHCSLFPSPCSLLPLFPRSSPRPISIIKLHTLLHFHR